MNAAFLLATAVWLSGADAAQAAAPPAAAAPAVSAIPSAPIATTPIYSTSNASCGASCGSCGTSSCDCCEERKGFFARLRGLFSRSSDCCEASRPVCCEAPKPVCCPAPKPVCCPAPKPICCEAPKPVCCPAPKPVCCDPCREERQGLLSRLFNRSKKVECCDSCNSCNSCNSYGSFTSGPVSAIPSMSAPAPGAMPGTAGYPTPLPAGPSGAEPIKKPMEEPTKPMPSGKSTQAAPPAVELTPASSKVIETETTHPF